MVLAIRTNKCRLNRKQRLKAATRYLFAAAALVRMTSSESSSMSSKRNLNQETINAAFLPVAEPTPDDARTTKRALGVVFPPPRRRRRCHGGCVVRALDPYRLALYILWDAKYHFVRHGIEERHIIVGRVPSEENLVDPFTKALTRPKHDYQIEVIGVRCSNISNKHKGNFPMVVTGSRDFNRNNESGLCCLPRGLKADMLTLSGTLRLLGMGT
ncbi:hypothetical protein LXL04_028642 [Taraxacum kok-saghyz]